MKKAIFPILLLLSGGTIFCLEKDRRKKKRLIDRLLQRSAKDKCYVNDLERELAKYRILFRRRS